MLTLIEGRIGNKMAACAEEEQVLKTKKGSYNPHKTRNRSEHNNQLNSYRHQGNYDEDACMCLSLLDTIMCTGIGIEADMSVIASAGGAMNAST